MRIKKKKFVEEVFKIFWICKLIKNNIKNFRMKSLEATGSGFQALKNSPGIVVMANSDERLID